MTTPIRLEPGQEAPAFSLPDQHGKTVTLESLRGRRVVLYTYPEAMTPGCTTEACDFRDARKAILDAGIELLGLSSDAPSKNRQFDDAERLGFRLLSDEDHAVQTAYGAYGERNKYGRVAVGPIRSTFVIGEDGRIEHALYNVRATGHVGRLLGILGIGA
ncbi:Putative peroxiredoxin [Pseudoclavibacter triregionum]|nr:Putative peroxiredoxin [Pseudoclavibacter triregionum]